MRIIGLILFMATVSSHFVSASAQHKYTYSEICKAGISTVIDKGPENMIAHLHEDGPLLVSYVRADGEKLFTYRCKLIEGRLFWGNENGRWRDEPEDSVVTWFVEDDLLIVRNRFSDGSVTEESFTAFQLSPD